MLYICTKYGNQYHVNDKAEITRLDQVGFQPSEQWHLLGIRHVKMTNLIIPFGDIPRWLSENPPLLYKNGNPQWTIIDMDHGTPRIWGNTKWHGIADIAVIKPVIVPNP
jgi:hypothetical protein